ncbi:hypothetical protein SIN8267_01430 [Sinobacterium norvegicum]|uniref:Uncharacterized protein n=1 Tax=Sinobacterium norvegicum TaxID=1641715 RepID=A0ABN8EKG2_9GAMM|nr:hypothetical protein SIN8267_01430 [Sinobacterium norvegicum]
MIIKDVPRYLIKSAYLFTTGNLIIADTLKLTNIDVKVEDNDQNAQRTDDTTIADWPVL